MRAPVLAVGDGALGFWGALREVFPQTWGATVLVPPLGQHSRRVPESAHPAAKKALAEIWAPRTRRTRWRR